MNISPETLEDMLTDAMDSASSWRDHRTGARNIVAHYINQSLIDHIDDMLFEEPIQ